MRLCTLYHGAVLLLALLAWACKEELAPTAPIIEPEKPVLKGIERLHGYWKVLNHQWDTDYCIADTMISRFVRKNDLGFNFRYTVDFPVVFTDSTIVYNDIPWYYYRFSNKSDTLFMSLDSAYRYPLIAVEDSLPSASERWCPILGYTRKIWMQDFLMGDVTGASYYGGKYYLNYRAYGGCILEVRNLTGDTLKTIFFAGGMSSAIANGFLWIGGPNYVERRNVVDTTVIQRIDLSSHYPFPPNNYIFTIAVHDSLIYVVIRDHLLTFNMMGELVNDAPTIDQIWFLTFVGDTPVAGTYFSTVHTVDVATGRAIQSYSFPEWLYGDTIYPVGGIADRGDRLVAFRTIHWALTAYEFTFPQYP